MPGSCSQSLEDVSAPNIILKTFSKFQLSKIFAFSCQEVVLNHSDIRSVSIWNVSPKNTFKILNTIPNIILNLI